MPNAFAGVVRRALEKEFVALGVASPLTDTARRIFERSAEEAGLFEAGRDRLVMPGFVPQDAPVIDSGGEGNGGGTGSGSGGGSQTCLWPMRLSV